MISISGEAAIIILGIVAAIVSAIVAVIKNRSIADKNAQLAEAEKKRKEAEGKLIQVTADAEQQKALADIARRQQSLLEAMKENIDKRDRAFNSRWRTVSALFNDIKAAETNTYNTLQAIKANQETTNIKLDGLPALVQTSSQQAVKEIGATMGAEIGAAMAREFRIKTVERALHPFPDAEDSRWHYDFITPTVPDVFIHKDPYFDDDVKLKKSGSKIAQEGELVRLIEEPTVEAIAVYKVENGVPCWGWLPQRSVRIGQATPEPQPVSAI